MQNKKSNQKVAFFIAYMLLLSLEMEEIHMRILAIGDIVGEVGVKKVKEILPNLKESENIDFVIANGENSADGMGITSSIFKDLLTARCRYCNNGKSYMG